MSFTGDSIQSGVHREYRSMIRDMAREYDNANDPNRQIEILEDLQACVNDAVRETKAAKGTFQQQSFAHRLSIDGQGKPEKASLEGIAQTFFRLPNHSSIVGDFLQGYADYLVKWSLIPEGQDFSHRAYVAAQENIRAGLRQLGYNQGIPEHLKRYLN